MKKAISIWSFGAGSVRECMMIAKDAGFEGIELALDEKGEIGMDTKDSDLTGIRKYAEELGLKIHSVATGLYWSFSLTSNDGNVRQKALTIAEKQILTAKMLGADSVLIVPGAVGVDFIPGCEIVSYDAAYDRSLEAFMMIKKTAEKSKINVGIENVWNKFLLSPLEVRDFIDKIDSPFVGAYIDVGNIIYNGYPEQWIRILGKRIKKVHFKDYRREAGGLCGFVDLLAGDVDWAEVMKAFGDAGYDGWATAEMIPGYKQHGEQIIYNTSGSMDKILGRKK
jgi:L-ribulose-5-phosphate 3-epimerase